jgi:hypothetical protein
MTMTLMGLPDAALVEPAPDAAPVVEPAAEDDEPLDELHAARHIATAAAAAP